MRNRILIGLLLLFASCAPKDDPFFGRWTVDKVNVDFDADWATPEMVRQYGKGEFKPGIYYTVKGKKVEDGIEFDFREVLYREVKACMRGKKGKAQKPLKSSVKRSGSMTGFTMPGMGSAIGGMY